MERLPSILAAALLLMSYRHPSASAFLTLLRPSQICPCQQQQQHQQQAVRSMSHPTWLAGFKRTTNAVKFSNKSKSTKEGKNANIKKLSPRNDLLLSHKQRIATAGKIGSVRFADPTAIFIGNLNYTTTEEQLRQFLEPLMATPWDIHQIRLVTNWKSGESKGYAFIKFTDPVFASLCLQELNGKEFLGRPISVKPANARSDSPLRKQQQQEQMRLKALRRAQNPPPPPPEPKQEDPTFLAYLDPDLAVGLEAVGTDVGYEDDADDGDYDGWEVPGSAPPKGFG